MNAGGQADRSPIGLRAVTISVAIACGALLASCGDDGALAGTGPISSLVGDADITTPDITAPDITLPDVTTPDITAPDITLPDVTAPATTQAPAPTTPPTSTAPAVDTSNDDSGLGPFGLVTLVLLAGLVGGLIVWSTRKRDHGSAQPSATTSQSLDRLLDDARWAHQQASEAARATDVGRVAAAWPVAREHFADIERSAAGIDIHDELLTSAVDDVGRSVAQLRGALDAFVDALGAHAGGHLDALGPVRDAVIARCDTLATRIQALVSARASQI